MELNILTGGRYETSMRQFEVETKFLSILDGCAGLPINISMDVMVDPICIQMHTETGPVIGFTI